MTEQFDKGRKISLFAGTVLGWFALIAQLYLQIVNRTTPVAEAVIRFFSYFTILTNIGAALCFTFLLLKPASSAGKFFSTPKTGTAMAAYMSFLGIIYNLILRRLWNPEGLQLLVDLLLHSIIPLFFVLFWLKFVNKTGLQWRDAFTWVIYPVVYEIYALVRGAITGFYPYPFFDLQLHGYFKVLLFGIGLVISFLMLSLFFIAVARWLNGRTDTG